MTIPETVEPGLKAVSATAADTVGRTCGAIAPLEVYKRFTGSLNGGTSASFTVANSLSGQTVRFVLQSIGSGSSGAASLNGPFTVVQNLAGESCSPNMAVSAPDGTAYTGQSSGTGQTTVEVSNASSGSWTCQIANPCETPVTYDLESEISGSGIITGIVVDSSSGSYLTGATVATSLGLSTQTESGLYALLHPAGYFSLNAGANGYRQAYKSLAIGSGGAVEMNIALDNGTQTGSCLFKDTVSDSTRLEALRAVRDRVLGSTDRGRRLVRLYYAHAGDVLLWMRQDRQLAARIAETVDMLFPLVQDVLQGRTAVPDARQRSMLLGCLELLRQRAGRELAAELKACSSVIESRQPLNRLFD